MSYLKRIHSGAAVGLMVTIVLIATSASPSALSSESASTTPPDRVAREFGYGAKSVIVLVSVGGKEHVATSGTSPPRPDQRFRIGSVTKTFTATIVLELVEEGKLRLNGTLADYLPGVVPRGDEITIRHLLGHRSGLVNFTDYPRWLEQALRSSSTRPIDSLRFAASKPLVFTPGTQERYSNTNYTALGLVVESITGHSYAQALERRIFGPLGLDETELPLTRQIADLADNGYNPNVPWAAGAIVSTARDLSRFYSALLSGRVLSNVSLTRMKGPVRPRGRSGAGLGMFPINLPCGHFWGHDGLILDYETSVSASEKGERAAVVSVRGASGPLPPAGRALLCGDAHVSFQSRADAEIAFVSAPGPVAGALYVSNSEGTRQGWLTLRAASPPAWSPDGRAIAFVSEGSGPDSDIYVTSVDGKDQRRLTDSAARDSAPAWSPDGDKITFVRERPGIGQVYVMNADGGGQRNLTRDSGFKSLPVWSPNGRTIAYLSKHGGNWEVYAINADGGAQRNLSRHRAADTAFAWSPDARRIAFLSKRDGSWNIYVVNADGSAQKRLTRNVSPSAPSWSPDGRTIAFVKNADISVMHADGSRQHKLTHTPAAEALPAWSPDGRKIAYVSTRRGNSDVYVMNADGSGRRNVTHSTWNEGMFAWSPAQRR